MRQSVDFMNPVNISDWRGYIRSFYEKLRSEIEVIALIIVLALWYFLNLEGSLISGEPLYASGARHYGDGDFSYTWGVNIRPLVIYFIAFGQAIFGDNTFGTRFFPYVFGIATVYITYQIGRRLMNRAVGFFSALFLGLIPTYQTHSTLATLETIRTFFVLALIYLAVKYPGSDELKKRKYIIFMGIVTACGFCAKQDMLFFILSFIILLTLLNCRLLIKIIKNFFKFLTNYHNISKFIKQNRITLILFSILGIISGAAFKYFCTRVWEGLSQEQRTRITLKIPGFFSNSLNLPDSISSWVLFLVLGIVAFFVLWIIYVVYGKDIKIAIRAFFVPKKVSRVQKIILFCFSFLVTLLVIYIPYLRKSHYIIYYLGTKVFFPVLNIFGFSSTPSGESGHLVAMGDELYTTPPMEYYLYWMVIMLGLVFVISLVVSAVIAAYLLIKRRNQVQRKYFLLYLYILVPLIAYQLRSTKLEYHLFPLFPLFMILITSHIFEILISIKEKLPKLISKNRLNIMGSICCAVLLLAPTSPLWQSIDNPRFASSSGYDEVTEFIMAYVDTHPGSNVTVVAHDSIGIVYYLNEIIPENLTIIDRLWGGINETDLHNMLLNGEIDIVIETNDVRTKNSDATSYIHENNIRSIGLSETSTVTVIYWMKE